MNMDAIIQVKVKRNPKRGTAADRFALYERAHTARQYVRACTRRGVSERTAQADLRWDEAHGFITLH